MDDLVRQFPVWIANHQLAAAAWVLTMPHAEPSWRSVARKIVEQALGGAGQDKFSGATVARRLRSLPLPLYTLRLLARIPPLLLPSSLHASVPDDKGVLMPLDKYIEAIIEIREGPRVTRWRGGRKSPGRAGRKFRGPTLSAAGRLIAAYILRGDGNATTVFELAGRLLAPAWKQRPLAAEMTRVLDALRDPYGSYEDKLSRIAEASKAHSELAAELKKTNFIAGWGTIEHFLLNGIHLWPLTILSSQGKSPPIGLGVPLGLDCCIGARDAKSIDIMSVASINIDGWLKSFTDARAGAIDLYLMERSNQSDNWLASIQASAFRIDPRVADAIFAPFAAGGVTMRLHGRSLEAFIAVAMLQRLLGRHNSMPIAMTGMIGERLPTPHIETMRGDLNDRGSRNRRLAIPVGCLAKVRWADASGTCDTFIMPADRTWKNPALLHPEAKQVVDYASGHKKLSIVFCDSLSRAADIALTGAWRRYRFIRCPDLERLLVTKKGTAPAGMYDSVVAHLQRGTR